MTNKELKKHLWINKLKPINKNNAVMFKKLYFKEYFQKHKQRLQDYKKEYDIVHKDSKREYFKAYREKNRDSLYEKIDCSCGNTYAKKHKSRHLKSEKHLNGLESKLKNY